MLAAANTGHDGTMTTIHASSAELALNERLVDLVRDVRNSSDEAIKRTIISAFEVVVQVSRGRKGQRYLSEIAIVDSLSMQNGNIKPTSLFIGEEQLDGTIQHRKVGKIEPGSNLQLKLALAGIPEDRW
jgi:pilus assembly protein CpaF